MNKPCSICILLITVAGCTMKDTRSGPVSPASIEGTWELSKYIDHEHKKTDWSQYGNTILYQKHITSTHFTWLMFNLVNEQLLGMGGGSYVIEKGKYIENIEFFFPPGSSERGQPIPFEITLKNGKWYHEGYAKELSTDPNTGAIIVTDSIKIEEIWVRTNASPNRDLRLVNTWNLKSYRDTENGIYLEYPDFIGYRKLITPTHFVWVKFDADGDEIYTAGSGVYTLNGKSYREKISMFYPVNSGQIGREIEFTYNLDDEGWHHSGRVPDYKIDTLTGRIYNDAILVDEIWTPYNHPVE